MGILVINFKNHPRILGDGALGLSRVADSVAGSLGAEIIIAPPQSYLASIVKEVSIPVYSQSVDPALGERNTGAVLPEAVGSAGASGTILNHSERRLPPAVIRKLVPRILGLGLNVCLCAESTKESVKLAALDPTLLAIEPPELIGSGVPVSRSRPDLISGTVKEVRKAGYEGRILCGAGIVNGEDAEMAMDLGVEGVLVSSGIVGARDWRAKVREFAQSMN